MAFDVSGRRKPTKPKKQARGQKRKRSDFDAEKLDEAVKELASDAKVSDFASLPLSEPTKAGLKACHFTTLTDIQARAIVLGLKGQDILGAAKTGSGKTLAFLVPVLENLYRQQCIGPDAGLGAMIISPTRELAIQIFDVLYRIGKHGHLFAAGLVIGGKSVQDEQQALTRMNIVVCTPGRILQHLSQTSAFNVDSLRMLVLDEADRIMDMGFQRDVDAIVEYLPADRQTLLFSATQTKRVSDLARLSLRDPAYVSVHESASSATPSSLQQNYVRTPLAQKLDTLWSFLQSAKKNKLLVFLSSGKQVRFVYEAFRKMQPGIPLLHLHGRQKQTARLDITTRFGSAKHACLFATDIAARGLDFPAVDWVVQVDAPEDADTYIHRVGRTARYERDGRAILFLDPGEEEGMLSRLEKKKVPIERINVRAKKQHTIHDQLAGMCFKDPELKYLGQKAFASYVRSLNVQKDKEVFVLQNYDLEAFAASLGLPGAPRIKFMKGDADAAKKLKNAPRQGKESDSDDEDASDNDTGLKAKDRTVVRTKYDRMFERRNQDVLAPHYAAMIEDEQTSSDQFNGDDLGSGAKAGQAFGADEDDDDDLFKVKTRFAPPTDVAEGVEDAATVLDTSDKLEIDSNRRRRALLTRKGVAKVLGAKTQSGQPVIGNKMVFDDETGEMRPEKAFKDDIDVDEEQRRAERNAFIEAESERLRVRDEVDRAVEREKRRTKRDKKRARERGQDGFAATKDHAEEGAGDATFDVVDQPFAELADLYSDEGDDNGEREPEEVVDHNGPKRRRQEEQRSGAGDQPDANAVMEGPSVDDLERQAEALLA